MKTNAMRILDSHGIHYVIKQHSRPVFTVEEAAQERGVKVSQIVKTMVVNKRDGTLCIVLIPGHHQLSLKKVGQTLADSKVQLATREQVTTVTGYQVGAVSPIGILRNETLIYFDRSILDEEYVDISSGKPDAGIELRSADLLTMLKATLGDFSK